MILVIWQHVPGDECYAEWQDLLTTLAVFELPLTVVLIGAAADALTDSGDSRQGLMLARLAQLRELDIEPARILLHSQAATDTPATITVIDNASLRYLCRQAHHVVHC
jgi:hypothetical protein